MLTQFPSISSWRKEEITLTPYEMHTLNFRDTLPNIFIIGNPNNAILKIALGAIPRKDSYEFKIEANSTETFGRPIGSNNLYILNDSSTNIKITVFSMEGEFNPQILKNTNITFEGANVESSSVIAGFAEGLSLDVNAKSVVDELQKLIKVASVGGYTNLYNLLVELQGINSKFDNLDSVNTVSGATNLKSIINALAPLATDSTVNSLSAKLDKIYSQLLGVNTTVNDNFLNKATEFSYTATKDCTIIFKWLTNDGGAEADIKIADVTVFTMLVDESFTDIGFNLKEGQTITIDCTSPLYRINYHII